MIVTFGTHFVLGKCIGNVTAGAGYYVSNHAYIPYHGLFNGAFGVKTI
jgi:hypothetical protein